MRSHAKAPSTFGALCLCVLGLVALLGSGTPSAGAVSCPNEAIRAQQGSTYLPDCRAYEQVTPVDKEAGNDLFGNELQANEWGLASPDGERAILQTSSGLGPNATGSKQSLVFSRSFGGWGMTSVNPADVGSGGLYWLSLTNPDLSKVGVVNTEEWALPTSGTSGEAAQSVKVGPPGGPYTTVISSPAHSEGENFTGTPNLPGGASHDFSHVVFESMNRTLAPAAEGQDAKTAAIYEWVNGQIEQVNVKTDGTLTSTCGAMLGRGQTSGFEHNAVSADGSKVFFASPDPFAAGNKGALGEEVPPACEEPTHIYARVDGAETIDVSAPEAGVVDPEGFQDVEYEGASEDGSKVFFKTRTELTADDVGGHGEELYEYDLDTETLTRISHGDTGTAKGDVQWVVVADNGSAVYFAQTGEPLAPGAPAEGYGFYRYDTESGETAYIATGEIGDWNSTSTLGHGPNDITTNWYATPNGEFLVFFSHADITGQNPSGAGQLYRYSAPAESVACVSCPAEAASGNAQFTSLSWFAVIAGASARSARPISEDGSRVFFDTPVSLVGQDTNGRRDVYEWEEGTVSLISSGKDGTDARFFDSSADGRNVFFGTHAKLALTDSDFEGDLYDARVEGGFPYSSPLECSGESCQGSSGEAARETSPGSAGFIGTGNIRQLHRCRRGTHRVRRHGKVRCVRKHHRRAGAKRGGSK